MGIQIRDYFRLYMEVPLLPLVGSLVFALKNSKKPEGLRPFDIAWLELVYKLRLI